MNILNWNLFLINEAKIQFFSDFEEILQLMKSPISKSILDLKDKDVSIDFNYFGLTDKEDIITFVQDSKVGDGRVIYEVISYPWIMLDTYPIRDRFGINLKYESYPDVGTIGYIKNKIPQPKTSSESRELGIYGLNAVNSDICHFVSLDDGKNYIIAEEYLDQKRKFTNDSVRENPIKIGRVAKKIFTNLGIQFSDSQYEDFVTEFKSKFELTRNRFRNFELVSGELIRKWYLVDNYQQDPRSTLQNSCMRYKKCQPYFDIYVYNPKVCQLLINKSQKDPSKISGRALIWTLKNGDKLMDQIYYSREQEKRIFEEYAISQGWIYSNKDGVFIKGDQVVDGDDFSVQLSEWEVKYYPFMDTFKYLNRHTGVLMENVSHSEERDCYFLESQNGGNGIDCDTCAGEGSRECVECEGSGDIECHQCEGSGIIDCRECDGDGRVDCQDCGGSGVGDDGESCEECDGSGRIDCEECEGRGKNDCDDCDSTGKIDCPDCGSDGSIECPDCEGTGRNI